MTPLLLRSLSRGSADVTVMMKSSRTKGANNKSISFSTSGLTRGGELANNRIIREDLSFLSN
jgi:hypothetical protein